MVLRGEERMRKRMRKRKKKAERPAVQLQSIYQLPIIPLPMPLWMSVERRAKKVRYAWNNLYPLFAYIRGCKGAQLANFGKGALMAGCIGGEECWATRWETILWNKHDEVPTKENIHIVHIHSNSSIRLSAHPAMPLDDEYDHRRIIDKRSRSRSLLSDAGPSQDRKKQRIRPGGWLMMMHGLAARDKEGDCWCKVNIHNGLQCWHVRPVRNARSNAIEMYHVKLALVSTLVERAWPLCLGGDSDVISHDNPTNCCLDDHTIGAVAPIHTTRIKNTLALSRHALLWLADPLCLRHIYPFFTKTSN